MHKEAIDAEFIPTSGLVEKLRLIKTDSEIKILKEAAQIADAAFEHILSFIRPGVSEIEVSNELEFFMRNKEQHLLRLILSLLQVFVRHYRVASEK